MPLVNTNPKSRSVAQPPQPTRPPPPLSESSFTPYELKRAFRGPIIVFELMEGEVWMWKPSLGNPRECHQPNEQRTPRFGLCEGTNNHLDWIQGGGQRRKRSEYG